MPDMPTKQSLGGGYGINRKVPADRVLTTAIPAMSGVRRVPGKPAASLVGKTGKTHFSGAKIYRNK